MNKRNLIIKNFLEEHFLSWKDTDGIVKELIIELERIKRKDVDDNDVTKSEEKKKKEMTRWEEEGITSRLANVVIAPEDLTIQENGREKAFFTYDEAEKAVAKLGNGWRLPTRSEWVLIAEEFGNDPDTGKLSSKKLCKALNMELSGDVNNSSGAAVDVGAGGFWWSSTRSDGYNMYSLYMNTTNVSPAGYSYRSLGFTVRCVKDIIKEKKRRINERAR